MSKWQKSSNKDVANTKKLASTNHSTSQNKFSRDVAMGSNSIPVTRKRKSHDRTASKDKSDPLFIQSSDPKKKKTKSSSDGRASKLDRVLAEISEALRKVLLVTV